MHILHIWVAVRHLETFVECCCVSPKRAVVSIEGVVLNFLASSAFPSQGIRVTERAVVALGAPWVSHLDELSSVAQLSSVQDSVCVTIGNAILVLVLVAASACVAGGCKHPILLQCIANSRPHFIYALAISVLLVEWRSGHGLYSWTHPATREHFEVSE